MGRGETNAKKRKRKSGGVVEIAPSLSNGSTITTTSVDTTRPTAVFKPTKGRNWTVSVALPGSIISNAQSHDLRTSLAGHIARALSVFCVDEVVIFSDGDVRTPRSTAQNNHVSDPKTDYTGTTDPDHFLVHLLAYLETPPHLRKLLFPIHPNLRTAGTLPSLDLPHHLRSEEWCPFREGVTLSGADNGATLVEAGLKTPVEVEADIPPHTRVTLAFGEGAEAAAKSVKGSKIQAEAVSPDRPREESGYYWGFNVRKTESLSTVFTECPYDGGYDVTVGTSERGKHIEDLHMKGQGTGDEQPGIGKFEHLLVVFGGVSGLEVALKNDAKLQDLKVTEVQDLFDHYVNVCPGQGSRTIRTEEAVWLGLMGLRRLIEANYS